VGFFILCFFNILFSFPSAPYAKGMRGLLFKLFVLKEEFMIIIQSGANSPLVVINTFTVKPEDQDHLIEVLNRGAMEVMRDLPGFISSSIHHGHGGTKVANYSQWEDRASFDGMLKNKKAQSYVQEISALSSKAEIVFYEVDEVHEKEIPQGNKPSFDVEARDISAD
jgi:heme-degrading monooxygenase HmoA